MVLDSTWSVYTRLPGPIRFGLNWFLRAAFASFLLAVWVNVASYWYAIRYGARPPVEGVPYLALVVGVLGFVLVILTIITIYGLPQMIRILGLIGLAIRSLFFRKDNKTQTEDYLHDRSKKKWYPTIWETISVLLAIMGILLTTLGPEQLNLFTQILERVGFDIGTGNILYYIILVLTLVFGAIFLVLISRISNKTLHLLSGIIYTFGLLFILLNSLWLPFDHILRATKFGGGIPASIVFVDGERISNAYLFFTTQNVITTYDPRSNVFKEFSRDKIVELQYRNEPVFHMPSPRSASDIFGLNFTDLSSPQEKSE